MNSKLYKLAKMILNLAQIKTNKGELISETVIEVGSDVFIEDVNDMLVAAPDGEYVTQDEVTIVVVDGKVAEMREKEQQEQPTDEQPMDEQPTEQPLAEEQPTEEQEPEQEQEPENQEPVEDEKDKRIKELEAQVEELNNIIVEKDEEIGRLKAELEKSDSKPAEEQLKSQKVAKSIWKPRF